MDVIQILDFVTNIVLSWLVECGKCIGVPRFQRATMPIWDPGIVLDIARLQLVGLHHQT